MTTESQVSGLEHEIESQKEDYEKKMSNLADRLQSIETNMKGVQESSEEQNGSDKAMLDELDKMKEEMSAKFTDVCTKVSQLNIDKNLIFVQVDSLTESLESSDEIGQTKFGKVEDNFNQLQTALRDIQQDNSRKIERVS
jgi:chromosome segregation ATPase